MNLNILYIIFFCFMFVLSFMMFFASRLDSFFKQGKIIEIRICYVLFSVIVSFLVTSAFFELVERIKDILAY